MNKSILMLLVALLLAVITYWQQGPGGRRQFDAKVQAKRSSDEMKERLNLTSDQMKQVETINLEASESMAKVFEKAAEDREATRLKIVPINESRDKNLKEIFTTDQWKEYEKMKEEQRERMRRRRGN